MMSLAVVSKHLKLRENAGLSSSNGGRALPLRQAGGSSDRLNLHHQPAERPERADLGYAHNREEAPGGASLCVELRGCQITPPALVLRNLAFAEAACGERQ